MRSNRQNPLLAIEIVLLAMSSEAETPDRARALLDRSEQDDRRQDILELISTIMVYGFPKLGWEAVTMMLDIQDVRLENTRAYQEIEEKVRGQEQRKMILFWVRELMGEVPEPVQAEIAALSFEQLEGLGQSLLRFKNLSELEAWLSEHR